MTILTIDDEENIRNGLADNFELEGYEVKQAASGEEGLKIVSEGNIDLVITDLRMDGISGEEVVRQVTTKYPGIPVIVLTGHGSIDDATEAMKSGAFDSYKCSIAFIRFLALVGPSIDALSSVIVIKS